MNALSIVLSVLSGFGVMASIFFGIKAYSRNNKKDDEDTGQGKGVILTEIGYIKSGVDDIKRRQEKQDQTQTAFLERLVCVEQSAKQAHYRLDEIIKNGGTP